MLIRFHASQVGSESFYTHNHYHLSPVSMPHRQDRSPSDGSAGAVSETVSMPHRQDRSPVRLSYYGGGNYVFPCLIGRIGVVYTLSTPTPYLVVSMPHRQNRSKNPETENHERGVVSMPHRQDRSILFSKDTGEPQASFHASQVGSEQPLSRPLLQPQSWFPCLIGRIGVKSYFARLNSSHTVSMPHRQDRSGFCVEG